MIRNYLSGAAALVAFFATEAVVSTIINLSYGVSVATTLTRYQQIAPRWIAAGAVAFGVGVTVLNRVTATKEETDDR